MTFRERCACGAEFQVVTSAEFEMAPTVQAKEALEDWRERHAKVCPGRSQHTLETCKDQTCSTHWWPQTRYGTRVPSDVAGLHE